MLRRIGTCRKKVMGLLRLMGNKADVVKGLAKRCNENWRVAPTSDIVSLFFYCPCLVMDADHIDSFFPWQGLYLSDIQVCLSDNKQTLRRFQPLILMYDRTT